MHIRKEKNFIPFFLLGLILAIVGIIYFILNKNLGVFLLLLIFGLLFMGIATYFIIMRKIKDKKLETKRLNKEYISGHIAEIKEVNQAVSKLLKEKAYEIIVETEINGTLKALNTDWVDSDFIKEKDLKRGITINICYLDDKNYYIFF